MSNNAPRSSLLRIVIPLAAALVGLLVVLSLMRSPADKPGSAADAADTQAQTEPGGSKTPAAAEKDDAAPAETPQAGDSVDPPPSDEGDGTTADRTDGPADDETAPATNGPLTNLTPAYADTRDPVSIGSKDDASEFEVFAEINPLQASVHRVSLTHKSKSVSGEDNYVLLHPIDLNKPGETTLPTTGTYATQNIVINGTEVSLRSSRAYWHIDSTSDKHATLFLTIRGGPDDDRRDIVKITRTYRVAPGSHTLELDQRVSNLSGQPLTIQWKQLAQGDVHHESNDYLRGRSRQFVTGYFDDEYDKDHFSVYVDDAFIPRPDLVSKLKNPADSGKWESVWPNPKIDAADKQLAWLASENRYFVAISSAHVASDTVETADVTALQTIYPKVTTIVYPSESADRDMKDDDRHVLIGLVSREFKLEPGQSTKKSDLSLDLFVGPREDAIFAQAPYQALRYEKTIRYSLGGFCGFCTFQWLAHLLLGFLELLHAVVFDWGVAIIILVLVVRLILHPITKRGQINMMKMGKQMAAIQPELNKLKKKYADDPRQMQQAQMQLFREKGINPAAGALGCLPMFLQMPIWIALYAMLYYAIELRHEHAFYGLFQAVNNWPFLADLSSADRFIPLFTNDGTHVFNLVFIVLDYSSINLLPILMGITFFINMKFTTPPPMNEQQATQQKIMRIMPLMFPFFLYSAPAGLTLYICASTMAGIIDSAIVRKHVREMEASGELFKPKPRKPGGFMDRLQKAAEMRAQQMEEMKKQKDQPGRGPQGYKKRKR